MSTSNPYPAPAVGELRQEGNGLGIAGFVLGLIGAAFGMIPLFFWFAGILGVLGLVFGVVGWRRGRRGARHKGLSAAGTLLGVVAITLSIVGAVIVANAFGG